MFSLPNLFIHFLYAFHSIVILVGWLVGIVVPGWSYCMPTLRVHYSVFHIETKKERINEFMWYVRRTRVDQVENDDDDIMNRARWDCAGSIRGIYPFIGGGAPTGEGVFMEAEVKQLWHTVWACQMARRQQEQRGRTAAISFAQTARR